MKLCRFDNDRLGVVTDNQVYDVSEALTLLPAVRWPVPLGDLLYVHFNEVMARVRQILPNAKAKPLAQCRLLAPVANPSKIIGAPANYVDHLQESMADAGILHGHDPKTAEQWGLFLKAGSSLIGPGQDIIQRFPERRNDHEAELAVVIGKKGSNIPQAKALSHVAGLCIGLDMTVRGPEFQCFRKSIDTYCVLGPWLTTYDECPDLRDIAFTLRVNGEVRQDSNTRYVVVSVERLIEIASSYYTLYPGDVILTGTPAGVGPVKPHDVIDTEFAGLGRMQVRVVAMDAAKTA